MRLSTDLASDEKTALATLHAALDAGIDMFDTARAYAPSETDLGHNERLLASALSARETPPHIRIITKCGMRRDGGGWIPDGRAKRIREDVAASTAALNDVPIDLLLLHAPDPRVPLATSGRALATALEDKLVRAVGVSNVSRKQLEELMMHAPITAVEVALGAYDDVAIRSGVVAYCLERGIEVLAHAPLGGPERAKRLAKDPTLLRIADRFDGLGALDVFLAYLLTVPRDIVPIVGARRPETIARLCAAQSIELDENHARALDARFPRIGDLRRPRVYSPSSDAEVVMLMGLPGAGKSRAASSYVERGYERLNRDTSGGTLRMIANRLDEHLRAGAKRLVLDNTYITRAQRSDVVRVAASHGARVKCVFIDVPLHEAQVNAVVRMIERFGHVVLPEEMAKLSRVDPAALAPRVLARMSRELEPPTSDEGFADIEVMSFVRGAASSGRGGRFIAIDALGALQTRGRTDVANFIQSLPSEPCLFYAWRPAADEEVLARLQDEIETVRGAHPTIELAVCTHPAGPPICWCRPPLPGLFVAFAQKQNVDLRKSTLLGTSSTDRRIAAALGMSFRELNAGDS